MRRLCIAVLAASLLLIGAPQAEAASYSFSGVAVTASDQPGVQGGFGSGVGTFHSTMVWTIRCSLGGAFVISDANGNGVTGHWQACGEDLGLGLTKASAFGTVFGGTGLYAGAQGTITFELVSAVLVHTFVFQMSFTTP